jgi:hypothetical protein
VGLKVDYFPKRAPPDLGSSSHLMLDLKDYVKGFPETGFWIGNSFFSSFNPPFTDLSGWTGPDFKKKGRGLVSRDHC